MPAEPLIANISFYLYIAHKVDCTFVHLGFTPNLYSEQSGQQIKLGYPQGCSNEIWKRDKAGIDTIQYFQGDNSDGPSIRVYWEV